MPSTAGVEIASVQGLISWEARSLLLEVHKYHSFVLICTGTLPLSELPFVPPCHERLTLYMKAI